MQYNSTFLSLLSLSDSLLSPVTYFEGFLKGSQRKHFHFCSHLSLSNGVRWRDSWLEEGREEGYTVSGDRHMGRWRVWWLDGGNVHCRLGEAWAVRGQTRCDLAIYVLWCFADVFWQQWSIIFITPLQRPTLNHIVREDALHCGVQSSVLGPYHSDLLAPLTPVTLKLHHVLALTFYSALSGFGLLKLSPGVLGGVFRILHFSGWNVLEQLFGESWPDGWRWASKALSTLLTC